MYITAGSDTVSAVYLSKFSFFLGVLGVHFRVRVPLVFATAMASEDDSKSTKFTIHPGLTEAEATFTIGDEDHTFINPLRFLLSKRYVCMHAHATLCLQIYACA